MSIKIEADYSTVASWIKRYLSLDKLLYSTRHFAEKIYHCNLKEKCCCLHFVAQQYSVPCRITLVRTLRTFEIILLMRHTYWIMIILFYLPTDFIAPGFKLKASTTYFHWLYFYFARCLWIRFNSELFTQKLLSIKRFSTKSLSN